MSTPSRIELLDVLRGFAILGTLGTNIWLFANAGNLSVLFGLTNNYQSQLEYVIQQATLFISNGKFLGMLTILFGVGLELQYQSAKKRGTAFLPAYLWRSMLLFLDGLLHFFLVIEFDILMGYAVTAMLVAVIVTKGERVMRNAAFAALGLHTLMAAAATAALLIIQQADFEYLLGGLGEINQLYLNTSYSDDVVYRLSNFWSLREEPFLIIPMGTALFLFGVQLMRAGAFANTATGVAITTKMLYWGFGLGIPLNLLALNPDLGLDFAARYVFAPIQAVGYIGLIALALRRGWLDRVATGIANIGRMALSNYMLQGVLASVLFYGWGFGLGRNPNAFIAIAAWVGISVTLLGFSALWLRHFKQGPFETLWKILSELPFKRGSFKRAVGSK
jgi:uncharacterized protein